MLESLFNPRKIAVIGGSGRSGEMARALVANLAGGGFPREIVPVLPDAAKIAGIRCRTPEAAALEGCDLCLVSVPEDSTAAAVQQAVDAGAEMVVVIGEDIPGERGMAVGRQLAAICRARGARLLGPGSIGVVSTKGRMNASLVTPFPAAGGISILSQSGALLTTIIDRATTYGIGLAKMVSLGGKSDVTETDLLESLAADPETRVIAAYLESIESGDQFIKVAEPVAAEKPLVILKVGTTVAGARAAAAHLGVSPGADIAYGAAFKRSGVVRARTFEELLDLSAAFAMQPLPGGNRVGVVTNSGGAGIMAADAVESAGLSLAAEPEEVRVPAPAAEYERAIGALLREPAVDGVVVVLTQQPDASAADTARIVAGVARGAQKPIISVFMGDNAVRPGRQALYSADIPSYPTAARAMAVLHAMWQYGAWRQRPPRVVTHFPVNHRRVERILNRELRAGSAEITDTSAKEILQAYGFRVPHGELASSTEEAAEIAARIGFPVALKLVSPDLSRKSMIDGSRHGLFTPDQVRDAFDLMILRATKARRGVRIEGVFVEEMRYHGREVIIGMFRDPQFGPMLSFGIGDARIEVMEDVTFHLAPITADEALQMLRGTRAFARLVARGEDQTLSLDAIASSLQRVSQIATDFPHILELELSPLLVGELEDDSLVVDARLAIAGGGA